MKAKDEILFITVFWGLCFILIPIPQYLALMTGDFLAWDQIKSEWLALLPFFIFFIIHHITVVFFLRRKRNVPYFICLTVLITLWAYWCYHYDPIFMENTPGIPPVPDEREIWGTPPPPPIQRFSPMKPSVSKFFLGLLSLVVSVGFESWRHMKKKEEENAILEREMLKIKLESLQLRINPHFFMNTMNNIKALVLTDQEKAVESIDNFSGMMRTILYHGDVKAIPLSEEICFLEQYIALMRLRYDDKAEIVTQYPEECGDAVIHPLVIATFIENAFKFGLKASTPSFVHLNISLAAGRIICLCSNSIHPGEETKGLGIGLDNVRNRLDLVYHDDYLLKSTEGSDRFEIFLDIPSKLKDSEL